MKNLITLLSSLFLTIASYCQVGYLGTEFSCEAISEASYNFTFQSYFSIGAGANCPGFTYDILTENDTLHIRAFYNVTGSFFQLGCGRTDTVIYDQIFPVGINYVKLSTNIPTIIGEPPYTPITYYDLAVHICDVASLSTSSFLQSKITFAISPNPTADYFSVIDKLDFNKINIINNLGQSVKRFDKSKDGNYNVSDLPSGIYHLSYWENNRKIGQVKMMKQ